MTTSKQPTRREACFILMQSALMQPMAVEYDSPAEARRWRDSCYRIKQSLEAAGDNRFDELRFSVSNSTLTVVYNYAN